MELVDAVVVGAGVVGLAVARALALRGQEVVVLEEAASIGTETSSRNSEVIHAGLYYPANSLKARLCVEGRQMLYAYAAEHGVPFRRLGKLIVASGAQQEAALDRIAEGAARCGVHDLVRLSAAEASALEPALSCTSALLSPSTGIIDSHALMESLRFEAEAQGTVLCFNTRVVGGRIEADGSSGSRFEIETEDKASGERFALAARCLINAAGLDAQALAASLDGFPQAHVPPLFLARGTYFAAAGKPAFSRLIYPVPEEGGLGVHLTLDMGGSMRFGPDVEWIDVKDYRVSEARKASFERAIRGYWPGLPDDALHATYSGIRPKLSGPGQPPADFLVQDHAVHGVPGLLNLFGIESPGLTASLALSELVSGRLAASSAA